MLRHMMNLKGAFPKKMLRKAAFRNMHFEPEPSTAFRHHEQDRVTGRAVVKVITNPQPTKTFPSLIGSLSSNNGTVDKKERRMVNNFIDLLEKMTILDPERRLTVREALLHPFVQET